MESRLESASRLAASNEDGCCTSLLAHDVVRQRTGVGEGGGG
jgi:hypothetical protein